MSSLLYDGTAHDGTVTFKSGKSGTNPQQRRFFFIVMIDADGTIAFGDADAVEGETLGHIPLAANDHYQPSGDVNGNIVVTTTGKFIVHTNLHNIA